MALLERVVTLLRANLNDLIDKAEDPPSMLKQLLRDMENQLMQLKTQVAIAMADQHVLETKRAEHEQSVAAWRRKAELALAKGNEALARAAIERSLQAEQLLAGYNQQLADQRVESDLMRQRYQLLETKLAETAAEGELLLTAHRRNTRRTPGALLHNEPRHVLGRMRDDVLLAEAARVAQRRADLELATSTDDQLRQLEQNDRVDAVLAELRGQVPMLEG